MTIIKLYCCVERCRDPAYAEYKKVRDGPAWAEYEKRLKEIEASA